jgi:molecular chaperone GrpE
MGDETNQPAKPGEGSGAPQAQPLEDRADASNDSSANAVESIPSLQELLKQAELKGAEHYDAWLRAKAEADNARKRAEQDVVSARKFALENFACELLTVKDSLEAALAVEIADTDTVRSGVELTLRQLSTAFEKFKIAEINPLGEKFDPHRHQAISMIDSDAAPNTIVTVMQKGYALHERILRPALVAVAKPKPEAGPETEPPA